MPSMQIRADIFPAHTTLITNVVSVGEVRTEFPKSRVILTLDHAYVFSDATPQPILSFSSPLNSYSPPPPRTKHNLGSAPAQRFATAETDEGTLEFYKDPSCGCGMKIKSMRSSDLLASANGESVASSYSAKTDSI